MCRGSRFASQEAVRRAAEVGAELAAAQAELQQAGEEMRLAAGEVLVLRGDKEAVEGRLAEAQQALELARQEVRGAPHHAPHVTVLHPGGPTVGWAAPPLDCTLSRALERTANRCIRPLVRLRPGKGAQQTCA